MTFSIPEMIMILWFGLAAVLAMIGGARDDEDCGTGGAVLLVLWIVVLLVFQAGAAWQRSDTNSKYLLIERSKERKP